MWRDTKAQAWGFDLIVASAIFLVGVVFIYYFSINDSKFASQDYYALKKESSLIAETLLTGGFPEDWNSQNVVIVGITDEDQLNETKLQRFYNLVQADYGATKPLFNIRYDYLVNFSTPLDVNSNEISYIGLQSSAQKNLAKTERVVVYKGEILTMEVFSWD